MTHILKSVKTLRVVSLDTHRKRGSRSVGTLLLVFRLLEPFLNHESLDLIPLSKLEQECTRMTSVLSIF